jgi:hypothetical protein
MIGDKPLEFWGVSGAACAAAFWFGGFWMGLVAVLLVLGKAAMPVLGVWVSGFFRGSAMGRRKG